MRLVCCYTSLHPAAVRSLRMFAPAAELADVTGDECGYWREISSRWDSAADLVVIEQDIEIGREVLPSFAACRQPWCTYGYEMFRDPPEWLTVGLGCVKFAAEAQRTADLTHIPEHQRRWQYLDGAIAAMLQAAGLAPHVHGQVIHHHEYEPAELPPMETRRAAMREAVARRQR